MIWPPTLDSLLRVTVHGTPRPQGSLQAFPNGGLKYPATTVAYRADMALIFHRDWGDLDPLTIPLRLRCRFLFRRPDVHYRPPAPTKGRGLRQELHPDAPSWHTTYPDADKCLRLVMDALTQARVIDDDSLVAVITATKRWTDDGDPRTDMELLKLEGDSA